MPGGGTLSLRMENMVLDEDHTAANLEAKPGRYVVISVSDTGTGMPPEIQDRIFEPFFTTKEHGQGHRAWACPPLWPSSKATAVSSIVTARWAKAASSRYIFPPAPPRRNVKPAAE